MKGMNNNNNMMMMYSCVPTTQFKGKQNPLCSHFIPEVIITLNFYSYSPPLLLNFTLYVCIAKQYVFWVFLSKLIFLKFIQSFPCCCNFYIYPLISNISLYEYAPMYPFYCGWTLGWL